METTMTAVEEMAEKVGAEPEDSDFQFGLAVYCMDYHGSQWSIEYQAQSELGASLRDSHIDAIRRGKNDRNGEWEVARQWYRKLKREWKA